MATYLVALVCPMHTFFKFVYVSQKANTVRDELHTNYSSSRCLKGSENRRSQYSYKLSDGVGNLDLRYFTIFYVTTVIMIKVTIRSMYIFTSFLGNYRLWLHFPAFVVPQTQMQHLEKLLIFKMLLYDTSHIIKCDLHN